MKPVLNFICRDSLFDSCDSLVKGVESLISRKNPEVLRAHCSKEVSAGVDDRVGGVVSVNHSVIASRGVPVELDCTLSSFACCSAVDIIDLTSILLNASVINSEGLGVF